MKKKYWVIVGIAAGFFVVAFTIFLVSIFKSMVSAEPLLGEKIALIEINDLIHRFNADKIISEIREYRKRGDIKAMVLRIDSPGGGVVASNEIYDEIKKAKEDGKSIVVSMGSVCASGGYYIASAADTVVANPGTITGSIGVIMGFTNMEGLLKKIGVKFEVIKSSKYKDIGSPFREMTPEEKALLKESVDDVYNQFVDIVCKERNLERKKVLEIADGRILTGRKAKELGLVDRLGTLSDAITIAGRMAGIEGEPKILKKKRFRIWDLLEAYYSRLNQQEVKLEYKLFLPQHLPK